ncbi:MAG TPA: DUF1932 domain-containing protein [Rhizobiaceae bacterium]|nr:DUF1932 domain-containing protein [Rhizobiaceae bacterium]
MKIGFIGFGEAARAFCDSLASREPSLTFGAYDLLLEQDNDRVCEMAMSERGVAKALPSPTLQDADWIISAVTADQSLAAAKAAAHWLRPGQIYFDINSVSPGRKIESAAQVEATGAVYLDMAVMAPVHPKGHATPVLLAGAVNGDINAALSRLGFQFEVAGDEPGAATAIKMVRSLFVKGLEAITVEALLAASASGCLDYIRKSLEGSYPGLGWPDFAAYQFERSLTHGKRRAAEMKECAATLDALGLTGDLARAIADVEGRMGALPYRLSDEEDLARDIATIATLRRRAKTVG